MTEEPKYLIVAAGWSDYDRFIRRNHLPAGRCFQFLTTADAFETRWSNMAQGIECQVCWTPEFLDQSPIGRRTS